MLDVLRVDSQGQVHKVGQLAQNKHVYFQYDADCLATGHSLSPFRLAPPQKALAQLAHHVGVVSGQVQQMIERVQDPLVGWDVVARELGG